MSSGGKFARVVDGNPGTHDVTLPTISPGDFVCDFTGVVPGMSRVELVAGTKTLVPLGNGVSPPPDVITPSSVRLGAGNLRVLFLITENALPAANRGLAFALESQDLVMFTGSIADTVIATPTAVSLGGLAIADGSGQFAIDITGPVGADIAYILQTNGPTGATVHGAATIPA